MKNPILFILILIFVLVNLADIVTMYFIQPGETNPIYLITKNINYVMLYKVAILWAIIVFYRRGLYPSNFTYYMLLTIIVLSIVVVALAVYSNILGMRNPELIEYASKLTPEEKVKGYTSFLSIFYVLPLGVNLLIFWLYDKSRNKIHVNKRYYKRKKWWQL